MKKALLFLMINILITCSALAQTHKRVLFIGVDGLKANVLEHVAFKLNKAPNIRKLMMRGKFAACPDFKSASCARTHNYTQEKNKVLWKSTPGWASVITGVEAYKHNILNNDLASKEQFSVSSKKYPSFLKVARDQGLTTAAGGVSAFMSSVDAGMEDRGVLDHECGESERKKTENISSGFADFNPSGTTSVEIIHAVNVYDTKSCNLDYRLPLNTRGYLHDMQLAMWLKQKVQDSNIDVLVGVFDDVDRIGHKHGFSKNKSYIHSIKKLDKQLEIVLSALEERQDEEWLVVLTADHGGHAVTKKLMQRSVTAGGHNTNRLEDTAVPFILTTFGATTELADFQTPVTHMDSAPTILHWLGVQAKSKMDGKVQGLSN